MTLLAPRDVARRLRLSTSRVVQLDREGILPAMRDSSGRRLYESDAVEAFALERERREREQQLHTQGEPRPAA
jgi:DNA-binding transcriptional MerR regulator